MRRVIAGLLAPLALAACGIAPTGTVGQNAHAGAGTTASPSSSPSTSPSTAATSAASSNTADSSTATGKGQPEPGQPSSAAAPPPPTVQPVAPPTAPPTPRPLFNDNDADNVNGGFVPANSDGDGQG